MKRKFSILVFTLCILYANYGYGQTGVTIGTQNPPDPSAILDLQTSQHGILIPRLTTTERNAIANPAEGLQIYNLTTQCLELYFPGQGWTQIKCSCTLAPVQPGAITGNTTFCNNQLGATYSISAVPGALSYQWTVPPGASVASGQGTTSITVNYGTQGGNISVTALNSCGTSPVTNLAVIPSTVNANFTLNPATPSIGSPSTFMPAFSVNGTQYQWTFASGSPATSTLQNPSVTWSNTGSYTVTLVVTDPAGCTATTSQTVTVINCSSNTVTFNYTGAVQTFTVPSCISSITVTAYGAEGGAGYGVAGTGGDGGMAQATIPVVGGEVLQIYVGQMGPSGSVLAIGGWNGGGGTESQCPGDLIGSGGGASDIRRTPYSLNERLIVAGGGGGAGHDPASYNTIGGAGGGYQGVDGNTASWCTPSCNGKGGTPTQGGAGGQRSGDPNAQNGTFGTGGRGRGSCSGGGGGGGGWYGGGGGQATAGGGGSSYTNALGNTNQATTPNVRTGDGQIVISY